MSLITIHFPFHSSQKKDKESNSNNTKVLKYQAATLRVETIKRKSHQPAHVSQNKICHKTEHSHPNWTHIQIKNNSKSAKHVPQLLSANGTTAITASVSNLREMLLGLRCSPDTQRIHFFVCNYHQSPACSVIKREIRRWEHVFGLESVSREEL